MTPIVFCASCMPWPSAIAAAETDLREPEAAVDPAGLRAAGTTHRIASITR